MYELGGKMLNGIKSLACVRVKRGESECFRISSSVKPVCIMTSLLFNVYMDAVIKEGSEISGGEKRAEIAWLLVCR